MSRGLVAAVAAASAAAVVLAAGVAPASAATTGVGSTEPVKSGGAGLAGAAAGNECKGFQVCVPVAGPWVVVPTGTSVPRPQVEYELTCPRGYVVGGLDAELTDRAIDLHFLGMLGTPVNPGITTSRSAVFVASYVGVGTGPQSFRPHIGCIPTAGGGQRVPTSALRVVPPGNPTVRRTRTHRISGAGSRTFSVRCARNEQLVDASHAVGFYSQTPPTRTLTSAAVTRRQVHGRTVSVTARGGFALAGVKAVVQVTAVCAGGR